MIPPRFTRREIISLAGKAALVGALAPRLARGAEENSAQSFGAVVGDPIAAKIGETILKDGGNAIDAAIAAAFAAGICAARNSGIGGYGGHAMIALAGGKKITAIDFNSAAPAAARADMFPLDAQGRVVGNVNTFGWLAAGVPGVAAGLDLALQRYGTRPLRDVLAPAIQMCEEGRYAAAVKGIDDLAPAGPVPPEKRRNLALAALLKTLAARNSTESFYRGDIARTIAAAFQSHGGLVTVDDLAAFRAREMEPLTLDWNGARLHTVPLTCTGLQEGASADGRLEVTAQIRNRENRRIEVQVNCVFKDANGYTTGDETPFQTLILTENATEQVKFTAMNTLAKKYTIRVRQAR